MTIRVVLTEKVPGRHDGQPGQDTGSIGIGPQRCQETLEAIRSTSFWCGGRRANPGGDRANQDSKDGRENPPTHQQQED